MMTKQVSYLSLLAMGFSLLGACAQNAESPASIATAPVTVRSTTTTGTTNTRLCLDLGITDSGSLGSRLEDLFVKADVSNIEGDVTYCLEISGSGDTADGYLRIEYEDDYGISSLDTDRDGFEIVVGEFKKVSTSDDRKTANFIFADQFGMVQVIANESAAGSKQFNGSIRFYNFPSYDEALKDSLDETLQKCRSGEWTVAKCLGYSAPTYWWNQSTYTTSLTDQAKTLLSGSSSKKLGDISFQSGDVVVQ